MPNFNLTNGTEILSTPAGNRAEAFAIFGREIGKKLTLDDQGVVAAHLVDEWTDSPHWVKPAIPVWDAPDDDTQG